MIVLKYDYYKLISELSVDSKISVMEAHKYIYEAENRLRAFDTRILYVIIHDHPSYSYQLKRAFKNDIKQISNHYQSSIQ